MTAYTMNTYLIDYQLVNGKQKCATLKSRTEEGARIVAEQLLGTTATVTNVALWPEVELETCNLDVTSNIIPFKKVTREPTKVDDQAETLQSSSIFTRETQSDEFANTLMGVTYRTLLNANIDTQDEKNQEALIAMYDLMRTITDRYYDVPNDLNVTRDIQAEHGKPFFLIGVAVDEQEDING